MFGELVTRMRIENVEISEVTIIGKEEKRVGIVDDAAEWVKGAASEMPPGGPYADRQAMLSGKPGGCGTVVRREKGRRWNTLVCE